MDTGVIINESSSITTGHAFDTLKLVIEPGGAVALAAALFADNLPSSDDLVVIISGGNVDEAMFAKALTIS